MLEPHAMPPEVSAGKSPLENSPEEYAGKSILDRPVHQLTEDDIAQLTREDCRRYLKEKGMRRPSWNKSQAIQQVIMLKKLLEVESEAGRPNNAAAMGVPKGTTMGAKASASVEETVPHRRITDLNKPDPSGVFSGHFASADDESAQPRTTGTTNIAAGQMTIFYRGRVIVYDDMPPEKARAIMHLAASPLESQEEELNDSTIRQPFPCLSRLVSTKVRRDSADVILPSIQIASIRDNYLVHGEDNIMFREQTPVVEGSSTRKASVQRYLEKRKDRFKSKRKAGTTSCSNLVMYFNHQMGCQILRVDTCSPTQTRQPSMHARCSSVDNDPVKNVCASTGLINKGLQVDST